MPLKHNVTYPVLTDKYSEYEWQAKNGGPNPYGHFQYIRKDGSVYNRPFDVSKEIGQPMRVLPTLEENFAQGSGSDIVNAPSKDGAKPLTANDGTVLTGANYVWSHELNCWLYRLEKDGAVHWFAAAYDPDLSVKNAGPTLAATAAANAPAAPTGGRRRSTRGRRSTRRRSTRRH